MDSKIKNVVFDLGGVLINLDFDNCLNAFRKAGFQDIEKQVCQFKGKGFFSLFELGEISPEKIPSNPCSMFSLPTFLGTRFPAQIITAPDHQPT